jgi:predicted transcriptional regulator
VQDDLFSAAGIEVPVERERVLMSLNPEYYELIWQGLKRHEFRRRYLPGKPTTWFVYLTAPVSRVAAVIDLGTAIVDTPRRIADIAEQTRVGNGESVYAYLQDLERGFAIPITQVREYPGFSAEELAELLGSFHPPQGYTLINRHPVLASVCDKLVCTTPVRQLTIPHPASKA